MIIVVLPSLTQKEWLAYLLGGVMPRTYRRFSREFKMQIVDSILRCCRRPNREGQRFASRSCAQMGARF